VARITVVNDHPAFLELVRDILESDDYDATTIDGDKPGALEAIRESRPDLLMIDLRMGTDRLHGWSIAQDVRKDPELSGLPILLCSADTMAIEELREQLEGQHQVAMLRKPFTIDALTEAIDRLLADAVPG
jgi:CheY-like chemotaxis protein